VLKWIIGRIEGTVTADETAIGRVPAPDQIDLSGLDTSPEDVGASLAVNLDEWRNEVLLIESWFDTIGAALPSSMRDELDALKVRLRRP
ncbi:MAG: phosphoenolpyruvate carboxykinase domain-containing protein, partial [Actinobacteria bacterium]|nr:phosphoenolpyruvate carboxykinase domain-containing protein [Actinomycetota bacterium]